MKTYVGILVLLLQLMAGMAHAQERQERKTKEKSKEGTKPAVADKSRIEFSPVTCDPGRSFPALWSS